MKIFITLVTMLAVSGVSYAGPAASDLGVSAGVKNISDTACQAPSAPVAAQAETADGAFEKGLSNAFCQAHPMTPGCPGYCKVSPAYPGCPLFCKDHHGHPACKAVTKAITDEAETADGAFDKGLSNAFCQAHPMTPGCPGYCKVSPAYPGCPLFCKDHHGHPACKAVTKGISDGSEEDGDMKKVIPGYPKPPHPQWCSNHHGFPGCR